MANRLGIELLPTTCRIIEVLAPTDWLGRRRARAGVSRVKAFHEIPYSPETAASCAAEVRRLMGRRVRETRVAVWGLRSTHQVLYLPRGSRDEIETLARRDGRSKALGAAARQAADSVMIGEYVEAGRVETGYVSVPAGEIQARVQPFLDAGVSVAGAVTPAVAHALLVRQRWGLFGDAATAVLSVNGRATAITVVRGGVVLFARELPWGHDSDRSDRGGGFDAQAFAAELAAEVRRSLVFLKQQFKVDVGHVLVCGDLADLRTLTGPLTHELSVEVETVDSLDGFDVAHLPEPTEEFRSRIGAYRTAWALAVDNAPPMNLVPHEVKTVRIDRPSQLRIGWAIAAAAVVAAAGWGAGDYLARAARTDLGELRRQAAVLEPELERLGEARRMARVVAARSAALQAFATQGPRLARVLEAIAKVGSRNMALNAVTVTPGVGTWRVRIEGQIEGENAGSVQSAFNGFLSSLRSSALLGEPVVPPSIRITSSEPRDPTPEEEAPVIAQPVGPVPVERPAPARRGGPTSLEVARDGIVWRIPIPPYYDVQEEARRRRMMAEEARAASAAAGGRRTLRSPSERADARWAPNLLDFTIEYEVRK